MLYIGGAALAQGMPRGSIMLQYNEWRIGDSHALLSQIDKRSMYGEKDIYYLTPEGKFGHIYVKGGLLGTSSRIFMVEKSKSQEWLNQLDEWRKTVN